MEKISSNVNLRSTWLKRVETEKNSAKNLPIHEKEKKPLDYRNPDGKAAKRLKVMKDRLVRYKNDSKDIVKPKHNLSLKIYFDNEQGSIKVFNLKNLRKNIGKRKIGPINLYIQFGDRLQIVGKNGTGKTTLIKMMVGELMADSGMIEKGNNVVVGYISQEKWLNRPNKKVITDFLDTTKISETNARKILNRFRITTEDVNKQISLISPGEYSRLIIAELIAMKPNCIILDEPSNHLDLEVVGELENGLKEYKGTLIVVSHDRYFVEKLKLTKIFDLDKNSTKL